MSTDAKKTIVITGANTGIGLASALELTQRGHRVIMACRNMSRATAAIEGIKRQLPQADVTARQLDLASFASVRQFAEGLGQSHDALDALVNNAGVYPSEQSFTEDGFELQIGVNYLGPFLLTHLLLPLLEAVEEARIVHVASVMHYLGKIDYTTFRGRERYSGTSAYAQSKLANVMFSNELARRLTRNVMSNALHPGGVDSEIYRDKPAWLYGMLRPFLISPQRAGECIADMAVSSKWKGRTGEFRSAHGPLVVSCRSRDAGSSQRLYDTSLALTGLS